jgi:membrane-associated two-gene conflict system component 1 (EACC1)
MTVELQIASPAASEATLLRETLLLQRLLSGQPDLTIQRPEDAPIAPGERGGVLALGRLLLSVIDAEAVTPLIDGLKVYLARSSDLSITLTGAKGDKIEVKAVNVAPDQIVETARRLRALLAT